MMAALQCLPACAWHCSFLKCMLLKLVCTASSLREGRERERERDREGGNLQFRYDLHVTRVKQSRPVLSNSMLHI